MSEDKKMKENQGFLDTGFAYLDNKNRCLDNVFSKNGSIHLKVVFLGGKRVQQMINISQRLGRKSLYEIFRHFIKLDYKLD